MKNVEQPIIGATRDESLGKTIEVFLEKLRSISDWQGQRLLDVGCGDGTFTIRLGDGFSEVYGIDVQDHYLAKFRQFVSQRGNYHVMHMSASAMKFPDEFFDKVVTLETLEHVDNLQATASEIMRVTQYGGEIVISVPNRLFPCENHGADIGRISMNRAPWLTYFPFLHKKYARARAFLVRDLDKLFVPLGAQRVSLDYLWPTFEHGGNKIQGLLKSSFPVMRACEKAPMLIRMFGTSILLKYRK
jgi:ubiquinone/menaquinone biosynthesis C-methylase UbiE